MRKKIGALNFFPAFTPPRSGGELRYYHLFRRLGQWYDVEMINPTYPDHPRERVEHAPNVIEHRFPKTQRYIWWHRTFDRIAGFKECSALVCGLSAPHHREMAAEARRLWHESDIFIHEFPYLFPLARRPRSGQLLVYDAHNVEYRLSRDMFPGVVGRWAAWKVKRLEGRCARAADVIFVCSEEDARQFVQIHRVDPLKIRIAPNGVDPDEIKPASEKERPEIRRRLGLESKRPAILFVGSYHPPNIEAVEFLCRTLAPALREVDFLVAGKVCQILEGRNVPGNLRVMGIVDETTKTDLLQGCDGAINPMFSGSGTNLKMLEYLSAGLPTITTPRGARGLDLEHRHHALVVDDERLVQGVEDVVGDPSLRRALAREGRDHVAQRFSWDAIARSIHEVFTIKTNRRVLLVNDFPVSPVQSGGQARLMAVGRQLAEKGHGVTILTLSAYGPPQVRPLGSRLEELNVPRSRTHRWIDLTLYHRIGVGADDVSAYLFGWLTPRFGRVLRREARLARAAVFSHCYLIPQHRYLPPGVGIVHDAYNVESDLKRQMYARNLLGGWLQRAVHRAEKKALRGAAFTACVSREDMKTFRELYPGDGAEYVLAPNGVDCRRFSILSREERYRLRRAIGLGDEPMVLFLASGHPPNKEAAQFLLDSVAPALPDIAFLFVGQVCGWFVAHPCPPNALLLGVVSDKAKDFLLQVSDLAVNPMFTGSGTNIKILDYLAAGLPVLTTPIGGRGIHSEEEDALVLCEAEDFVAEIQRLLRSPEDLALRASHSHELALRSFDWSVTLRELTTRVQGLTDRPTP